MNKKIHGKRRFYSGDYVIMILDKKNDNEGRD